MKQNILLTLCCAAVALLCCCCAYFRVDNEDAPDQTLKGKFVDPDGNLLITDAGTTVIRLEEVSYLETHPDAVLSYGPYLWAKPDGTYQNTKLFAATYNLFPYGAFMPFLLKNLDGEIVYDATRTVEVKGVTEVDFVVQPFLYVEIDESSVSESNGKLEMDVYIRRGVSKEEFKDVVSLAGNYSEAYTNVTDIQLYLGYSPFTGQSTHEGIWSNYIEFAGNEFETDSKYGFDKPIHIKSIGQVPAGRKIFFRAAARINYQTESTRRYNFSEIYEWQF